MPASGYFKSLYSVYYMTGMRNTTDIRRYLRPCRASSTIRTCTNYPCDNDHRLGFEL